MVPKLAKSIEEMRGDIKNLTKGIAELKKEMDEIKDRSSLRIAIPSTLGMDGDWDWGTISEEAILRNDPLILPTQTAMETLFSTVQALKDKQEGATAEEIAYITGRARNTESAYLRRLHLAGKVQKIKDGKKVKYRLLQA